MPVTVMPDGMVSVTVTGCIFVGSPVGPGPLLVTVMVNDAVCPCTKLPAWLFTTASTGGVSVRFTHQAFKVGALGLTLSPIPPNAPFTRFCMYRLQVPSLFWLMNAESSALPCGVAYMKLPAVGAGAGQVFVPGPLFISTVSVWPLDNMGTAMAPS